MFFIQVEDRLLEECFLFSLVWAVCCPILPVALCPCSQSTVFYRSLSHGHGWQGWRRPPGPSWAGRAFQAGNLELGV